MKEYEENNTKDDFDFKNRSEDDDNSSSNDPISPFKQTENEYNRMHQTQNNYPNNNVLKSNKKKLSFLDDFPEQDNNDLYDLNDDSHFFRFHLNDEQKEYLMPRNSTLISKILDFFFNW